MNNQTEDEEKEEGDTVIPNDSPSTPAQVHHSKTKLPNIIRANFSA